MICIVSKRFVPTCWKMITILCCSAIRFQMLQHAPLKHLFRNHKAARYNTYLIVLAIYHEPFCHVQLLPHINYLEAMLRWDIYNSYLIQFGIVLGPVCSKFYEREKVQWYCSMLLSKLTTVFHACHETVSSWVCSFILLMLLTWEEATELHHMTVPHEIVSVLPV